MSFQSKFSNLGAPRKIWAVSAVQGDVGRLVGLHGALYDRFSPGDRLIYTGNYLTGSVAGDPVAALDEILYFRRTLLARFGARTDDFVYLRGIQEELWNKLQHLQFTVAPAQTLSDIQRIHPEMEKVLNGYDSSFAAGLAAAREGVLSLSRWSAGLKAAVRKRAGHEKFFSILRRAAFTENKMNDASNILFVHAGIDPHLSLLEQGDSFFWAAKKFSDMSGSYPPFRSVVRGFDPDHGGLMVGPGRISLDAEGAIVAEMTGEGDILEILAA